jgi:hypothetical protein
VSSKSAGPGDPVYSVHAARTNDVGAVEIVFTTEREARAYAADRSTDWCVLAASVTRFMIGAQSRGTWTGSSSRPERRDPAGCTRRADASASDEVIGRAGRQATLSMYRGGIPPGASVPGCEAPPAGGASAFSPCLTTSRGAW